MQNKVVAHFMIGTLIKGITSDFFPNKEIFHLTDESSNIHVVDVNGLKALFFVKSFEGNPGHQEKSNVDRSGLGKRVRVDFKDGETIMGYTQGYSEDRPAFFVSPADPDSNNIRVFINKEATRKVSFMMASPGTRESGDTSARESIESDEPVIMRCPLCGVKNRVNTSMLDMKPKCGKCGAQLI